MRGLSPSGSLLGAPSPGSTAALHGAEQAQCPVVSNIMPCALRGRHEAEQSQSRFKASTRPRPYPSDVS